MDEAVPAYVSAEPARETLRDARSTVIGVIERQRLTGKVVLRDAHGIVRGSYDRRSNETRDASGRLIGRGYLMPALLAR